MMIGARMLSDGLARLRSGPARWGCGGVMWRSQIISNKMDNNIM